MSILVKDREIFASSKLPFWFDFFGCSEIAKDKGYKYILFNGWLYKVNSSLMGDPIFRHNLTMGKEMRRAIGSGWSRDYRYKGRSKWLRNEDNDKSYEHTIYSQYQAEHKHYK